MIDRRRGFALLTVGVLAGVALAPVKVGDARAPVWMQASHEIALLVRGARERWASVAPPKIDLAWLRGEHGASPATTTTPMSQGAGRIAPATTPDAQPQSATPPAETQAAPTTPDPAKDAEAEAARKAAAAAVADDRIRLAGHDPAGVRDAITAYRADNLAAGDTIAAGIADPLVRTALEWVALRNVPQKIGMDRLDAFRAAHPAWPTPGFFRNQAEARTARMSDPLAVLRFYESAPPVTPTGKLALAHALKATGRGQDADRVARALFRESDLQAYLEGRLIGEFGDALTRGDYKYKADRLMYKDQAAAALRWAAPAGPDVVALEKARAAIAGDNPGDKAIAAVPESLRRDPGLILAEVQKLRRADRLVDAANMMQSAPRDRALLIDGDEWWTERRVLARKLLDAGQPEAAYTLCATASPQSTEARIEAAFHAGWIALRFMNEPPRAAWHFAQAAAIAESPLSIARIAYWQARTAAAGQAADSLVEADAAYRRAAVFGATYYGQLARAALGRTESPLHAPIVEATGADRDEAVRAIELLFAAGEKESATALALDMAASGRDDRQLAALAAVIRAQGDAHLALAVGKIMGHHGSTFDEIAYPTYGIPHYDELLGSAPRAVVYSIARQESAFQPGVVSKAGAKGLMQMIDATAKRTAQKAGLPFDGARMLSDPSFNARLGAAHLGELVAEQSGSLILTFAAYNAGGGRVKQWIDAYGDPRKPGVDAVDWVERIPFTETRNYVQKVLANVGMYEALFAAQDRTATAAGAPARIDASKMDASRGGATRTDATKNDATRAGIAAPDTARGDRQAKL